MRFQKPMVTLTLACLIFMLFTCGETTANESGSVKLNKETAYYNDYLGFSFSVPKGSFIYDVNEYNLGLGKGDIIDSDSMEIILGIYEGLMVSRIWLLAFDSKEDSSMTEHLGFNIDALFIDGIADISGFIEYYEMVMQEPADKEEYRLTESDRIIINGTSFELRDYTVSRTANNFRVLTLSCQAKNGYFLNISVDYWPANANARQVIIDTISKGLELY